MSKRIQYVYLQPGQQPPQQQQQPKRKHQQQQQQPAKQQPQGGMDGFTFLMVTAVLTVLALAGLEALGVLS